MATLKACDCLIVGDRSDLHVAEVTAALEKRDRCPLVVDAPSLRAGGFALNDRVLCSEDGSVELDRASGWLRRYAPTFWGAGTVTGTLEAVTSRAFLGLVGSISRVGATRWLTSIDAMLRAEDRLWQLELVSSTGSRVPRTVVSSDGEHAAAILGRSFVVKPLVGGYYNTGDGPRAVFAGEVTSGELPGLDFGAAPFVAQERLHAHEHLRVVTVEDHAWVAGLTAEGRPLDWRQQDRAHFEWSELDRPEVAERALRVAADAGIGYPSQDWIIDDEGPAFLDLNPGGQWLFLPEPIASEITATIAEFLAE